MTIPEKIEPLRYWCQKVLPLVYDDSLSYYEMICKIVTVLNNISGNVSSLNTGLIATIEELETVKEEIESGMDEKIETKVEAFLETAGIVTSVNGKSKTVLLNAADVGAVPADQGRGNAGKILGVNDSGSVVPIPAPSVSIPDHSIGIVKFANAGASNAGKVFKVASDGSIVFGEGGGGGGTGGAVESVNGKTGAVMLSSDDVNAVAKNQGYENYGKVLTIDQSGNVVPTTLPASGVTSVNSKTGAVVLTAADVGARPNNWVPTAAQVGARPSTWTPTAQEVGALPSSTTLETLGGVQKDWGTQNAGAFLVVGSGGIVSTKRMAEWSSGGLY